VQDDEVAYCNTWGSKPVDGHAFDNLPPLLRVNFVFDKRVYGFSQSIINTNGSSPTIDPAFRRFGDDGENSNTTEGLAGGGRPAYCKSQRLSCNNYKSEDIGLLNWKVAIGETLHGNALGRPGNILFVYKSIPRDRLGCLEKR
jgi:hypothetical protein